MGNEASEAFETYLLFCEEKQPQRIQYTYRMVLKSIK